MRGKISLLFSSVLLIVVEDFNEVNFHISTRQVYIEGLDICYLLGMKHTC